MTPVTWTPWPPAPGRRRRPAPARPDPRHGRRRRPAALPARHPHRHAWRAPGRRRRILDQL